MSRSPRRPRLAPLAGPAAALLVLTTQVAPAAAEGDVADPLTPRLACKAAGASTRLTVQFQPDTSLRDLAAWLTTFTCKNVVFSAEVAQVGAKVNILAPAPMSPKQAQRLFVTAVEALGLVVEDKAGTVLIKPGRALAAGCAALARPSKPDVIEGELGGNPFDSAHPRLPDPAPEVFTTAEIEAGIKPIDEGHVEVRRALVDKLLANPMAVSKGARVVPSMKDGVSNGFKLYAIRPSSAVARLGLRNGDTIQAVNGHDLSTADKALEVYTTVRTARRLELTLLRRGRPMTLVITIK